MFEVKVKVAVGEEHDMDHNVCCKVVRRRAIPLANESEGRYKSSFVRTTGLGGTPVLAYLINSVFGAAVTHPGRIISI
jgi:hypothetical protein